LRTLQVISILLCFPQKRDDGLTAHEQLDFETLYFACT
jgi:hypothetical protein